MPTSFIYIYVPFFFKTLFPFFVFNFFFFFTHHVLHLNLKVTHKSHHWFVLWRLSQSRTCVCKSWPGSDRQCVKVAAAYSHWPHITGTDMGKGEGWLQSRRWGDGRPFFQHVMSRGGTGWCPGCTLWLPSQPVTSLIHYVTNVSPVVVFVWLKISGVIFFFSKI